MLRASEKRLFSSGQLSDIFGGSLKPLPSRMRHKLPYTANLLAWYDASDLATITDAGSGAVSAWADKSGNGYTLTEATNRPTTGTRSQNGLNVVDFDGTNDVMASSCPADDISSTTFIVAKNDAFASGHGTLYGGNGNGADLLTINTSGVFNGENQSLNNGIITFFAPGTAGPFIVCQRYNGSSDVSIISNTTQDGGSVTVSYSSFTAGRTLVLGGRSTSNTFDGWIGEFLRYSAGLSQGNIFAVMAYLADKWAVSL